MKRLFIAGELDEGSAEQLESQIQRFRTTFAREAEAVRWVARERYHLTLVFLGDTEERQIPGVREIVRQCAFPGIPELRIGPPIVFPRPSSPRVLARSVGAGAEELGKLASRLRGSLEERQLRFDSKPFTAHITAGYLKRGERSRLRQVATLWVGATDLGEITGAVSRITLFESSIDSRGPRYIPLESIEGSRR